MPSHFLLSAAARTLSIKAIYKGGEDKEDVPAKPEKNEAAAEMGRKGAAPRAANLSPEKRAEIARKAAAKRWSK